MRKQNLFIQRIVKLQPSMNASICNRKFSGKMPKLEMKGHLQIFDFFNYLIKLIKLKGLRIYKAR